MDRVKVVAVKPLLIRSGHTPVNIGLMVGSLFASIPALATQRAHSHSLDSVLPSWATYVFYAVLLLGSAMSLAATWKQLPTKLNAFTYHLIVSRLVRERIGHYAVACILLCFSVGAAEANGVAGLSGTAWLVGVAVGLLFRARQTHVDVAKLHAAMHDNTTMPSNVMSEPDGET